MYITALETGETEKDQMIPITQEMGVKDLAITIAQEIGLVTIITQVIDLEITTTQGTGEETDLRMVEVTSSLAPSTLITNPTNMVRKEKIVREGNKTMTKL